MNWKMTWVAAIVIGGMCATFRGCGSGGQVEYHRVIPDGYKEMVFVAGGATGSAVSHELGISLDASVTGTGSSNALAGPTSIYDGVSVLCAFTFDSATNTEGIQITNSQNNCINENECIVCTASGNGTTACGLSCTGVVPSSSAVAADSFDVGLAFTTSIVTDMPDPYGTIRYDASRIGTGFDLSSPSLDSTGCEYSAGDHKMGTSTMDPGNWFTSTAANFRRGLTITALDPDTQDNNHTRCALIATFTSTPTLSGAATPGTTITNDLGMLTFKGKICDYRDVSATSHDLSVCTE